MSTNKKYHYSGRIGMDERWEIEWNGVESKWVFWVGSETSWSHYSSEELIKDLIHYQKAGHPENAYLANLFAKELERCFDIKKGSIDKVDILRMSPDELVHAPWYDVFICHASEDKDSFVRPLANALLKEGCKVWFDEFCLEWGDKLRQKIDHGLASSKFGIIVLSPSFFEKNWTQYELDGLFSRQMEGESVILPIWHNVTKETILKTHPSLVNIKALDTSKLSTEDIVNKLTKKLQSIKKA